VIATETITVEALTAAEWPAVRAIFEEGIATDNATFETEAPSWDSWNAAHLAEHRYVARRDGEVIGWAALSRVSERCVYTGVAEVSVYVAEPARGQGVGRVLLGEVVWSSEQAGIWTLQAGVFPENEASLAIHRANGFRVVGIRVAIGKHHGVWRDVVLLERRSAEVS
jgi:phosphinothricin acetyltransferase